MADVSESLQYKFTTKGLRKVRRDMKKLAGDVEDLGDEALRAGENLVTAMEAGEDSIEDLQSRVDGFDTRRMRVALQRVSDKFEAIEDQIDRLDNRTIDIHTDVDRDRIGGGSSRGRSGGLRLPGELDEVGETISFIGGLSPKVQALGAALTASAVALGSAGGLAAAATKLANQFGDADLRQDLSLLKQRFRSVGAQFVDEFEPVIRSTIIPAGVALAEKLRDVIPELRTFTEKNLPTLSSVTVGLVEAMVETIKAFGLVSRGLGVLISSIQGIAKLPGLIQLFGKEDPFAGVRKEMIDIFQGLGFGGQTVAGVEVPQSQVSRILERIQSGELTIGPETLVAPDKLKEITRQIEQARIKFKELGVTTRTEFLQALVDARMQGVDALTALQAKTGEVPPMLDIWVKKLKEVQKRLANLTSEIPIDQFSQLQKTIDRLFGDIDFRSMRADPAAPEGADATQEVGPTQGGTFRPGSTSVGSLREQSKRLSQRLRRIKDSYKRLAKVGSLTGRILGDSVGALVSSFTTFGDEIVSVKERFKQFGKAVTRILSRVVSRLASAVAEAAVLATVMSLIPGFGQASFGANFGNVIGRVIPSLDSGGFVKRDTLAMIHAGEVVAPLDQAPNLMGGGVQSLDQSFSATWDISLDRLRLELERNQFFRNA
jgi:hypothetical protein